MTTVLQIDSSINGSEACSPKLTAHVVERLRDALGEFTLIHRDLGKDALPHYTEEKMNQTREAQNDEHDKPLRELEKADYVVIGAPMYNFSVPGQLKTWIDYCAVPKVSFKYTDEGPVGLLKGKTAIICTTRGSKWKGSEHDHVAPYLDFYLRFLGIDNIHIIYAEGISMGEKEQAMKQARESIDELIPEITESKAIA